MNTLRPRLRDFKLSCIYNSPEDRLTYAQEKSFSYLQFVELLMENEATNRHNNSSTVININGHSCRAKNLKKE